MTKKWHNGPNGPGTCRAVKGKCPFGGAEEHFDSKEEAQKIFEEQSKKTYGLLPGMNSEPENKPSILATNSHGISMSNSNYAHTGQGTEADRKYFESKFEPSKSAKEIADSLNNDPKISGQWKPLIKTEEKMVIRSIDPFGNESRITVQFKPEKPEKPQRAEGHMYAYSPKTKIAQSISNFVSYNTLKTGTKGAEEHFNKLIKGADYDAAKMARTLNQDKHVNGRWKVKQENNDVIILQQEDVFKNISEVNIQKPHYDKPKSPAYIPPAERKRGTLIAHSVVPGPPGSNLSLEQERKYHHITEFVNIKKLGKSTEDAENHISSILRNHNNNPDELVQTLNKDKSIYGKWKASYDYDDRIVLECKKPGEGSHYITVYK